MESKGGKKKSSSSSGSKQYEAPLGYSIEDVRPAGGIKKFQSAAYSNLRHWILHVRYKNDCEMVPVRVLCRMIPGLDGKV
ncbi:S-adenosyl-l-methionine decarboxylase leader peptide [Carex littledalei]|uniref:S-adenosyl-l-methionine decarboxylase leader peptide n=1 Tax=Carex littledalei TaxID=544730 RepID=A0A833VRT1_9POAL|nr:S-adenosyl-l-methionine decarboxylase leader peptide [Carex littledalei]